MSCDEYAEFEVNERSTLIIQATLKDEDGVVIPSAAIDSIKLTLIESESGSTINSRAGQGVLNANDCTMHPTTGVFTWNVQSADTAIANTGTRIGDREDHLATFTVVWATTKQLHFEVLLKVLNLRSVPQV